MSGATTATTTCTQMPNHPAAMSSTSLLDRTSFLKKLSNVRTRLVARSTRKGDSAAPTNGAATNGQGDLAGNHPYRKARSMDVHGPPFASQPALGLRAGPARVHPPDDSSPSTSPLDASFPSPPRTVGRPSTALGHSAPADSPLSLAPSPASTRTAGTATNGHGHGRSSLSPGSRRPATSSGGLAHPPPSSAPPATAAERAAPAHPASTPPSSMRRSMANGDARAKIDGLPTYAQSDSPFAPANASAQSQPRSVRRSLERPQRRSMQSEVIPEHDHAHPPIPASGSVIHLPPSLARREDNGSQSFVHPSPVIHHPPSPTVRSHASTSSASSPYGTPALAPQAPPAHAIAPPSSPPPQIAPIDVQPFAVLPPSLERRDWDAAGPAPSGIPSSSFAHARAMAEAPAGSPRGAFAFTTPGQLHNMPPRPHTRLNLTGGARLSPSIISRQPTMPILSLPPLPPLPPPTPSEPARLRPTPHARLRSMPTLSMMHAGAPAEAEEDHAEHDNAMLDEDEDDDESHAGHGALMGAGVGSDDDDFHSAAEDAAEHASPQPRSPRSPLPARMDLSALRPSRVLTGLGSLALATGALVDGRDAATGQATPKASRIMDYFSAKSPDREKDKEKEKERGRERDKDKDRGRERESSASPTRTPRAPDAPPPPMGVAQTPRPLAMDLPRTTPRLPPALLSPLASPRPLADAARPGLTHHASRSMVDLLSPKQERFTAMMGTALETPGPPPGSPLPDGAAGPLAPALVAPPMLLPSTDPANSALRKRRSMPTFDVHSPPPPYPDFHPRAALFRIAPREDEGRERLPAYSNSIHLRAIMPRKLEFTAPGVQAKDRKWRRVMCELSGTTFKVYRCPPGAAGVGAITEWWENRVGAGDVAVDAGTGAPAVGGTARIEIPRRSGEVPPGETRPPKGEGEGENDANAQPTASVHTNGNGNAGPSTEPAQEASRFRSRLANTLLHPSRAHLPLGANARSRLSVDVAGATPPVSARSSFSGTRPPPAAASSSSSRVSPPVSASATRLSPSSASASSASRSSFSGSERERPSTSSMSTSASMSGGGANPRTRFHTGAHPSSSRSSGLSRIESNTLPEAEAGVPEPDARDLLRAYTLQNAESGLGSDYLKRKNVIRVRMEGEQFLLQAQDVSSVVDWIEGFQAATNVALDLDERPMPRGPLFPRRRRRRPRPGPDNAAAPSGPGPRPISTVGENVTAVTAVSRSTRT